ncbi:unnamed protein product [Durusdinium trenchii]|uniref:Uncharacterized protein n=1 Tax=Durusdinium trenchii TaxID=1381693 RepID=A0ABP0N6B4_9DINO
MATTAASQGGQMENPTSADPASPKPPEPLRARRPPSRSTAENEVYVARRQSLAVLFKIVRKLFDRGHSEVLIHAMGPCITKALHLTQDVLLLYGDRVTFHARHGTVDTVDAAWMVVEYLLELCSASAAFEELIGELDVELEERRVSSLTIQLQMLPDTVTVTLSWNIALSEGPGHWGALATSSSGFPEKAKNEAPRSAKDRLWGWWEKGAQVEVEMGSWVKILQ